MHFAIGFDLDALFAIGFDVNVIAKANTEKITFSEPTIPKLLIGWSQIILLSAQCSYRMCNIASIQLTSQTYQLNFVSVVRA